MNMNIINLEATLYAFSSYCFRNNVVMNKNTSKYCHESNTTFSPIGDNNNIIWSVGVKNYMNNSKMEAWFI